MLKSSSRDFILEDVKRWPSTFNRAKRFVLRHRDEVTMPVHKWSVETISHFNELSEDEQLLVRYGWPDLSGNDHWPPGHDSNKITILYGSDVNKWPDDVVKRFWEALPSPQKKKLEGMVMSGKRMRQYGMSKSAEAELKKSADVGEVDERVLLQATEPWWRKHVGDFEEIDKLKREFGDIMKMPPNRISYFKDVIQRNMNLGYYIDAFVKLKMNIPKKRHPFIDKMFVDVDRMKRIVDRYMSPGPIDKEEAHKLFGVHPKSEEMEWLLRWFNERKPLNVKQHNINSIINRARLWYEKMKAIYDAIRFSGVGLSRSKMIEEMLHNSGLDKLQAPYSYVVRNLAEDITFNTR